MVTTVKLNYRHQKRPLSFLLDFPVGTTATNLVSSTGKVRLRRNRDGSLQPWSFSLTAEDELPRNGLLFSPCPPHMHLCRVNKTNLRLA